MFHNHKVLIYFLPFLICSSYCLPAQTIHSFIIISNNHQQQQNTPIEREKRDITTNTKPQIYYVNVRSDVKSRYAKTLVTSRISNPANESQEVFFEVTIPESAFVSKFKMEINGEISEGVVKERQEAKQQYNTAKQSGQSAGHVATANIRDSSRVQISVNVAALSKATFNLTYEELLVRRKDHYELLINLSPGQVVRDMKADVYIEETANITSLQVPKFKSTNEIDFNNDLVENDENAVITIISGHQVHIHFEPPEEAQRKMGTNKFGDAERGLSGQFIVKYNVERTPGAGEILANDGYFVHFFSPPQLEPLPKHVIFVLDVSGSMSGRKIEQLREAMTEILSELKPGDYFNIIEFSDGVTILDLESPSNNLVLTLTKTNKKIELLPKKLKAFPANNEYILKAKQIVQKMSAGGGTNIFDSLKASIDVAARGIAYDNKESKLPEPIIIFLTDGEATVGETNPNKIMELIHPENTVPVFTLAFGNDADLSFLKRLSIKAGAFARKIYEAADAALQLKDFYSQVASPLLSNVKFSYLDTQVDGSSLTQQKFLKLFSGSELVVAGKLAENNIDITDGDVSGTSTNGSAVFSVQPIIIETTPPPQPVDRFLERLWAFLTIKQQLDKYTATMGEVPDPIKQYKIKATQLALKYGFVTPVTSLVVVKQNETQSPLTEKRISVIASDPILLAGVPRGGANRVVANGFFYLFIYPILTLHTVRLHVLA